MRTGSLGQLALSFPTHPLRLQRTKRRSRLMRIREIPCWRRLGEKLEAGWKCPKMRESQPRPKRSARWLRRRLALNLRCSSLTIQRNQQEPQIQRQPRMIARIALTAMPQQIALIEPEPTLPLSPWLGLSQWLQQMRRLQLPLPMP